MGLTVLDAGVLIALLDSADLHHEAARAVLRRELAVGNQLSLPVTAYAELLVAPMRHGHVAVDEVDRLLADLPASVGAATPEIAKAAARLRATHGTKMRLPDAFVVATAETVGADLLVTTDAGWPPLGVEVEVLRAST